MKPTAGSSRKGFTLIEVLVALVILSVAMLGVLDAMAIAMQQNVELYCRDEAVRIAEQDMNQVRNTKFDDLGNSDYSVTRTYKQFQKTFNVKRTLTKYTEDVSLGTVRSYSVQVQVSYTINGRDRTHNATSIVSRGV